MGVGPSCDGRRVKAERGVVQGGVTELEEEFRRLRVVDQAACKRRRTERLARDLIDAVRIGGGVVDVQPAALIVNGLYGGARGVPTGGGIVAFRPLCATGGSDRGRRLCRGVRVGVGVVRMVMTWRGCRIFARVVVALKMWGMRTRL